MITKSRISLAVFYYLESCRVIQCLCLGRLLKFSFLQVINQETPKNHVKLAVMHNFFKIAFFTTFPVLNSPSLCDNDDVLREFIGFRAPLVIMFFVVRRKVDGALSDLTKNFAEGTEYFKVIYCDFRATSYRILIYILRFMSYSLVSSVIITI